MSCTVSAGRTRQCRDAIGGIKTIFLNLYSVFEGNVASSGSPPEVTTLPTATLYRFELDGANSSGSMSTAIQSSVENGTRFYETTVEAMFQKMSATDRNNLEGIIPSQLAVFVLDNNNNLFYVGNDFGCEVTGGTYETGTGLGDFNGYKLTITARAKQSPLHVDGFTTDPFDNFSGITISPVY